MLKKDTKVEITEAGQRNWSDQHGSSLVAGDEGYVAADERAGATYIEIQVPTRDEHSDGDSWPLSRDEFKVLP